MTLILSVTLLSPLSSSSDSYRVSSSKNKMGSRSMSAPRSTLRDVSAQRFLFFAPVPSGFDPETVPTLPRYGVVNVQSYAEASSFVSHAATGTGARDPGPAAFEGGSPPPKRSLCASAHFAAAATFRGGRSSSSHSRSASSALKCTRVSDAACVSSRTLPYTISGRCGVPSRASNPARASLPRMGVRRVRMSQPETVTPSPPGSKAPPASRNALASATSAGGARCGAGAGGGPLPGKEVIADTRGRERSARTLQIMNVAM